MFKVIWQQAASPSHTDGCATVHLTLHMLPWANQSQNPKWSVWPFLHSSRQTVATLYNGLPLSSKTVPSHRDLNPHHYMIPWALQSPQPKQHLDWFSRCFTAHRRVSLYFKMDHPSPPQNCPFPWGDVDPHVIHGSLCPPESTTQTASRSVQPFFAELTSVTDHATQLVTIGRIYVQYTVLQCGLITKHMEKMIQQRT